MKNPQEIKIGERMEGTNYYYHSGVGTPSYMVKNHTENGEVVQNKLKFVEIARGFDVKREATPKESKTMDIVLETETGKYLKATVSSKDIQNIFGTLMSTNENKEYFSIIYIKDDYKVIPYSNLGTYINTFVENQSKPKKERVTYNLAQNYKAMDIFVTHKPLQTEDYYMSWVFVHFPKSHQESKLKGKNTSSRTYPEIYVLGKVYIDLTEHNSKTDSEYFEMISNLVNNNIVNSGAFFVPLNEPVQNTEVVNNCKHINLFKQMEIPYLHMNFSHLVKEEYIVNTNGTYQKSFDEFLTNLFEYWEHISNFDRTKKGTINEDTVKTILTKKATYFQTDSLYMSSISSYISDILNAE